MVMGRVVRFDATRGYGFIAPELGGEDVFLHANDLLIPESSVRSGTAVEFEVGNGDRGLKSSSVRLAPGADAMAATPFAAAPSASFAGAVSATRSSEPRGADGEESMCDVLSVQDFAKEVTELLLQAAPELTGKQILLIRKELVKFGENHGWAEEWAPENMVAGPEKG
ncbi:cold-shock protein [Streptacidiphilus sp. BW17]|uniref:cold-shock protein n=1 Tax=Streptacidiphilus sp. BW17 TaxID=3156274 RepID=UPI0035126C05